MLLCVPVNTTSTNNQEGNVYVKRSRGIINIGLVRSLSGACVDALLGRHEYEYYEP